jgi:hypothetical protein
VLQTSFGVGKSAHPNFRGDYEGCLNLHDDYDDDLATGNKTFIPKDPNLETLPTGQALDEKCTTMAAYPDMGVSAFMDGGYVWYIIGLL